MGIKFLGIPLNQWDQLCSEEEKVMITVECFKSEEIGHPQNDERRSIKFVKEDVKTYGHGIQVFSSKDIFQIDDEPDAEDYPSKKEIRESLREKLR